MYTLCLFALIQWGWRLGGCVGVWRFDRQPGIANNCPNTYTVTVSYLLLLIERLGAIQFSRQLPRRWKSIGIHSSVDSTVRPLTNHWDCSAWSRSVSLGVKSWNVTLTPLVPLDYYHYLPRMNIPKYQATYSGWEEREEFFWEECLPEIQGKRKSERNFSTYMITKVKEYRFTMDVPESRWEFPWVKVRVHTPPGGSQQKPDLGRDLNTTEITLIAFLLVKKCIYPHRKFPHSFSLPLYFLCTLHYMASHYDPQSSYLASWEKSFNSTVKRPWETSSCTPYSALKPNRTQ